MPLFNTTNPVKLTFPERCTPENISLFSGFKATIPHLVAPHEKHRYRIDGEVTSARRAAAKGRITEGQALTHSILHGVKHETTEEEEKLRVARLLEECRRVPTADFTPPRFSPPPPLPSSSGKRARLDVVGDSHGRPRRLAAAEARRVKQVRYANAISAWDRAKRRELEERFFRPSYEGSISAIIRGIQPSRYEQPSTPPRWSDRNSLSPFLNFASSPSSSKPTNDVASLFDEWASFDVPEGDPSSMEDSLPWLAGGREERPSFGSSGTVHNSSSGSSRTSNSPLVNGMLREWFS